MIDINKRIKDIFWTFRNETENKEMIKELIKDVYIEVIGERSSDEDSWQVVKDELRIEQINRLNQVLKGGSL